MRWYAVGAVAAAFALAFAYGPSYLGYDAAWALVWGSELAGGHLPSYEVAFAPTPHPLTNVVAMLGEHVLVWVTWLGFGALVAGAWALGAEIGGLAGGAVAAALVATRSDLGREAAFTSVDLPFLALVVWAAVAAARRGPASAWPYALLAAAGLMRPEAWGLAAALWVWAAVESRRAGAARVAAPADSPCPAGPARLVRLGGLALLAPVLWVLSDLVVTGDPLWSLHGTRELAAALERPRGAGTALGALDDGLRDLAGSWPVLAGLVGGGLAVFAGRRRAAVMVCVAVLLGVAGFVALGAAGLPVLFRYLLVPAVLLLVLAGAGFGAAARRSPVAAGAVVVAALLLVSVPTTIDDLAGAHDFTVLRAEVHDDLRAAVAGEPPCEPVVVPGFRARPFVLLDAGNQTDVRVGNLPDGERGVLFTYADAASELIFNLGAPGEARRQAAPLNARPVADNRSWRVYAVC